MAWHRPGDKPVSGSIVVRPIYASMSKPRPYLTGNIFLHRSWISPWIKSISNELDIIIHVIASQLSGYYDVINNPLWRNQQNATPASEARGRCVKVVVLSSFSSSLCRERNKIMYVLSWRTVSALTRVLFWCLLPSLLRNSGNRHQNNPLVSALTVRHSSTYIFLYVFDEQTRRSLSDRSCDSTAH